MLVRAYSIPLRTGRRVQRASGIPCALFSIEGEELQTNLGRNASRERETISAVIASEAKQSMSQHEERMDCFVASLLAMTVGFVRVTQYPRGVDDRPKSRGVLDHLHARVTTALCDATLPTSLRGALATKQSIPSLCGEWIASLRSQ